MAFKLGQTAQYLDSKGHTKLALITGTPETVTEGTDLATLNPNQYAVIVFSPSGQAYPRFGVQDGTAEDFPVSEYTNENDSLTNVLLPVE